MRILLFLIVIFCCSPVVMAQGNIKCSGVVTEWVNGKEKVLSGAMVIVGKQLSLVSGNNGVDTIKGKVAAKAITDSKGFASLSVPKGTYTVIIWKAGYVPKTYFNIEAKSYEYMGSISRDTSMRGLHITLAFETKKSILDMPSRVPVR